VVGHCAFLDKAMISLANSSLKTGVLVFLLWWGWIHHDGRIHLRAVQIVFRVVPAVFAARVLQNNQPHRPRPIHHSNLGLTVANSMDSSRLEGWSSYSSDHAVLVFALTAAIWSFSRGLGVAALL
jgi:undecaprenyl-diphosphatase